jgi:hypothetical protein
MTEYKTGITEDIITVTCSEISKPVKFKVTYTILNGDISRSNSGISFCFSSHKCKYQASMHCPKINELNTRYRGSSSFAFPN